MKGLAVLGSTGSIGRQTLEVVRAFPDRLRVVGLAARRSGELLEEQVRAFRPSLVSFSEGERWRGEGPVWVEMEELARRPEVDVVVVGVPGLAALRATLAAVRAGKTVALASKEVLVVAGGLVMAEAAGCGGRILPVDSEHSAIWQCLQGERRQEVRRLVLTASGGPFRGRSAEELRGVTPEEALSHPTWRMGPRVTVDSATLMNKGFEVIEAHWLYDIPYSNIDVVVHPQSIVHSLVEFTDGSVKAQMGPPDMRLPIQYALSYPERWPNSDVPPLDLVALERLTFEALDEERFPCYRLARGAGERGGTYPAVLQAADEVAVELFLQGRLGLPEVAETVRRALESHRPRWDPSLEELLEADAWARSWAQARGAGRP